MINIVQPNSIVLRVALYDDFLANDAVEFCEMLVDVNKIDRIDLPSTDKDHWILRFIDEPSSVFVIENFDIDEFFRCIAKLEKANCKFGVSPDKTFIWKINTLVDILNRKEINKMSTKATKQTEKKNKNDVATDVKKDKKTSTTSKKTEEKVVSMITKISFFGESDNSSFVAIYDNGTSEVVQNDKTHDKLKNRIEFMKGQGYHTVEDKKERTITFVSNSKLKEEMKSTLKDIIKEQLDKSDGKFYYMDFNKLSKGAMKCVTSGVDSSPTTPNEMILFMIGCVLKLMAIGEVSEVTTQPPFVNSVRAMLDAIKCTDKCISDELEIKPAISTSVEEVNGFECRNCNNSRRVHQEESDRVKELIKHIDALMDMIDF